MNEVNTGTYKFQTKDGKFSKNELCFRVMVGIRSNPASFVGEIPIESIFVAITGRDGSYRSKDEVDHVLDSIGEMVAYVHERQAPTARGEAFYIKSDAEHASIFDDLHEYADIVYPDPSDQEAEQEQEEEDGVDRPF